MLTYTMDVEERSRWLISTPSQAALAWPFVCSEAGAFYARSRFVTTRSSKASHLLFYTLAGEGYVEQGGQQVRLTQGQALLMDCREPQSYGTSEGHDHWYHLWAHIDGMGVDAAGKVLGLPKLVPVTLPPSRVRPHFDVLFDLLEHESIQNASRVSLAAHALCSELVVAAQAPAVSAEGPVELACAYIRAHFGEPLSVDDLASVAAVSPSHLIRLFKRRLGTTPHDYLMRYRISRAKELLAETALTSAVIAERVGFASESNFSYRFKQVVGQSPRAYRQSAPELVLG